MRLSLPCHIYAQYTSVVSWMSSQNRAIIYYYLSNKPNLVKEWNSLQPPKPRSYWRYSLELSSLWYKLEYATGYRQPCVNQQKSFPEMGVQNRDPLDGREKFTLVKSFSVRLPYQTWLICEEISISLEHLICSWIWNTQGCDLKNK